MSVRVTWQPSTDPIISSYELDKAAFISGPWVPLATVLHLVPGANWDAINTVFFYVDSAGNESTYYRITAVDTLGQRSAASAPFRVATSPLGVPSLVRSIAVPVGDPTALSNLGYTTIEVWESVDEGGSWHEVTASIPQHAFLDSSAFTNTLRVGGLGFSMSINGGVPVLFSFDGSVVQDWTAQQVADRINEVVSGLASVVGQKVRLTSPTAGRASTLLVTSDSTPLFGAARSSGQDQRLLLSDQNLYQYFDVVGSSTSRYKWRFSNDGVTPVSPFSVAGLGQASVDPSKISVATATFVGMDGRPTQQSVLIAPVSAPMSVSGVVAGSDRSTVFTTDENGQLQVPLVRGLRVRVGIEGTSFVREFVVPDQPNFDLLQVMSAAPDTFTVQPTAPLLTRRHI